MPIKTGRNKRHTGNKELGAQIAEAVLRNIQLKRKVSVKDIALKNGASMSYATSGHLQETKGYKEVMENYAKALEKERARQLFFMAQKDLSKEQYKTLSEATARATHDIQLLTGGATERTQLAQESEVIRAIIHELAGEKSAPLQAQYEIEPITDSTAQAPEKPGIEPQNPESDPPSVN